MKAYHYTTRESYRWIQSQGLKLSLEERHKVGCQKVLHLVERGCIWVYPEAMRDQRLIGMVMYVACRHRSSHVVCLEVKYPEVHSASWLVSIGMTPDSVALRHTLDLSVVNKSGIGPFDHNEVFDLVTEPILPSDICLVGEWDLLRFVTAGVIGTEIRMVA